MSSVPPKASGKEKTHSKASRFAPRHIYLNLIQLMKSVPWIMALVVSFFLSLLIVPRFGSPLGRLEVGDFVDHAIKANRDFDVEDEASTQQRRTEAAGAIFPIYDHDAQSAVNMSKKIEDAFSSMRLFFQSIEKRSDTQEEDEQIGRVGVISSTALADQEQRFMAILGVDMPEKSLNYLEREGFSEDFQNELRDLVNYALTRLVINDRQQLLDQVAAMPSEQLITLREIDGKRERVYSTIDNILSLDDVLIQVDNRAKSRIANQQRRALQLAMAHQLIKPTLNYNLAATEERKSEAREKVGPSIIHLRKNQLIVAEGEQITQAHLNILAQMYAGSGFLNSMQMFFSVVTLLFAAQLALAFFGQSHIKKFKPTARDYAFLASVAACAGFLAWLGNIIAKPLADSFTWLTVDAIRYLFPIVSFAMVTRFLMYSEAVILLICLVAPLTGLVVDSSLGYTLFVMIGSLIGAHKIGRAQKRVTVMRAGFMVGLVNMLIALAIQLYANPSSFLSIVTLVNVLAAFFGGVITGPFALAILPAFESVFGYASNLQLMELANLSHPLLERMMVEAPGTYHHSLGVSMLAEKGAESIGANPLLAKVSGLYHDIGKINKPQYFIENQYAENPHDHLPPRMSSLILIAHVREGVDFARRYRLGERIEHIIAQHHGTSQIRYFYDRAKQMESADKNKVEESEFRYKGPKPQMKEAALVMLADVIEAATRSLKTPTPARIESTVLDLINSIHSDGQLDECDMTLRDLHKVAISFAAILHGRYHGRIEYPGNGQSKRGKVVNIPTLSTPDESTATD